MSLRPTHHFSDSPLFAPSTIIELASECKHAIHQGDSTAPYSDTLTGVDAAAGTDSVGTSATILLCDRCEAAMRAESTAAKQSYTWHFASGTFWTNFAAYETARLRAKAAALRTANHDAKTAALACNSNEGAEAQKAKLAKWQAGKKVTFDVAEGEGAGEKPKEKTMYVFGPP